MKTVLITGATGCIGHYVVEALLPTHRLVLLTRNPDKFSKFLANHPHISFVIGDLGSENFEKLPEKIEAVIHLATDWGPGEDVYRINVDQTLALFSECHRRHVKQFIYFSTASILDSKGNLLPAAKTWGTPYIRSKYLAYEKLTSQPFSENLVCLFPTMVLGGNPSFPYSHLSGGIRPSLKYLRFLKYVYVKASFHFIHAADIAIVVSHLVREGTTNNAFILGQPPVTVRDTLTQIASVFQSRPAFQLPIPARWLMGWAKWVGVTLCDWSRYCIENPYFVYPSVSPESFGRRSIYPNLKDHLQELATN